MPSVIKLFFHSLVTSTGTSNNIMETRGVAGDNPGKPLENPSPFFHQNIREFHSKSLKFTVFEGCCLPNILPKIPVWKLILLKTFCIKVFFVSTCWISILFLLAGWPIYVYAAILQPDGCAPAAPSGLWHLTFAPQWLENLRSFHRSHRLGTLAYTGSRHWAPFNFS